jgi:aspartate-semialdehyde dehydrogenase
LGRSARIGVVGATGAVGSVTLALLRERGYENVRAFASARSAGTTLGRLEVEEATPEALAGGELDACLFSVGTAAARSRSTNHRPTACRKVFHSSSRK